ncbi:hypothetical protein EJB05_30199 [Eragrostis curvula]|uniref:Uncharacterized protein n=1 Tax=Eragrostis curvula TaxID=38414 RepID=A0A5J9UHE7_9POAL|nr:hypothetical protein EJB05_30199 [Eragrostis curvula]
MRLHRGRLRRTASAVFSPLRRCLLIAWGIVKLSGGFDGEHPPGGRAVTPCGRPPTRRHGGHATSLSYGWLWRMLLAAATADVAEEASAVAASADPAATSSSTSAPRSLTSSSSSQSPRCSYIFPLGIVFLCKWKELDHSSSFRFIGMPHLAVRVAAHWRATTSLGGPVLPSPWRQDPALENHAATFTRQPLEGIVSWLSRNASVLFVLQFETAIAHTFFGNLAQRKLLNLFLDWYQRLMVLLADVVPSVLTFGLLAVNI